MISERLDFFRKTGTELFGPLARLLIRFRITANIMTTISFFVGLIAVYFLFNRNGLYAIFVIIYFICDILDGEIARITKNTTKFGMWFDHLMDRSIMLLLLIKSYFYLDVPYLLYWSVLIFFLIQHLIHILSNRKLILIYSRAAALIIFPFAPKYPIEAFVVLLTINSFGIVLQMVNLISNKYNKKKKKRK